MTELGLELPKDGAAGQSGLHLDGDGAASLTFGNAMGAAERFVPAASPWRAALLWEQLQISLFAADITVVTVPAIWQHILSGSFRIQAVFVSEILHLSALVAVIFLFVNGAYATEALRRPGTAMQRVCAAWGTAALVAAAVQVSAGGSPAHWYAALGQVEARAWLYAAACTAFLHLAMTQFTAHLIHRRLLLDRVVVVCGREARPSAFIRLLQLVAGSEIELLGVFTGAAGSRAAGAGGSAARKIADCRLLGTADDLPDYVRQNHVDRIIIVPGSARQNLSPLISRLSQLPVRIDVYRPKRPQAPILSRGLAAVPLQNVANERLAQQSGLIKRAEDVLLAGFFLVCLAPLLAALALAVRFSSPGPVLFKQQRYGLNNRVFEVYKFRTMYHRAAAPDSGIVQATRHDPRVTPLGRFLRRSSLDELPQLFNVLQGTMSVVGPRPHEVRQNIEYSKKIEGYFGRHRVNPGITGWAQVNGYRGETETIEKMRKRIEYDLYYIDNWSLYLDLKVIFLTFFKVWFQRSAY